MDTAILNLLLYGDNLAHLKPFGATNLVLLLYVMSLWRLFGPHINHGPSWLEFPIMIIWTTKDRGRCHLGCTFLWTPLGPPKPFGAAILELMFYCEYLDHLAILARMFHDNHLEHQRSWRPPSWIYCQKETGWTT